MSYELGALIEPLSVGVHAARRANIDLGMRVLITGAGPIGMVSAIAARAKGACDIWMTDVIESRLELARSMGIKTLNVMNRSQDELLGKITLFVKCKIGINSKPNWASSMPSLSVPVVLNVSHWAFTPLNPARPLSWSVWVNVTSCTVCLSLMPQWMRLTFAASSAIATHGPSRLRLPSGMRRSSRIVF